MYHLHKHCITCFLLKVVLEAKFSDIESSFVGLVNNFIDEHTSGNTTTSSSFLWKEEDESPASGSSSILRLKATGCSPHTSRCNGASHHSVCILCYQQVLFGVCKYVRRSCWWSGPLHSARGKDGWQGSYVPMRLAGGNCTQQLLVYLFFPHLINLYQLLL